MGTVAKEFEWTNDYWDIIMPLIKFANEYSRFSKIPRSYGTEVSLALSDYQVIEKIHLNETERRNMSALAKELGITQSAFSKIVQRLVNMGIVEKFHAANNRKDVILCVSDFGKKVYSEYSFFVYNEVTNKVVKLLDTVPRKYIDVYNRIFDIMGSWSVLHEGESTDNDLIPIDRQHI